MLIRLCIFCGFIIMSASTLQAQSVGGDPTRPPSVIAQQLTPLQPQNKGFNLSAIFTRNDQRYAVLNGDVVKKGDQVLGMQVTEINAIELTLKSLNTNAENIVLQVQNNADMKKQVVK